MTRSSASGWRLLVRPSDCGKFSSWRNLPADVAVRITGQVARPRSLKRCLLDGQREIKICLKTDDEILAQPRSGDARRQIEAIIETPLRPATFACPPDTEVFPTRLEMREKWVKSATPDRKEKDDNHPSYVDRFVPAHRDHPICGKALALMRLIDEVTTSAPLAGDHWRGKTTGLAMEALVGTALAQRETARRCSDQTRKTVPFIARIDGKTGRNQGVRPFRVD